MGSLRETVSRLEATRVGAYPDVALERSVGVGRGCGWGASTKCALGSVLWATLFDSQRSPRAAKNAKSA